jgi:hypothetical protein
MAKAQTADNSYISKITLATTGGGRIAKRAVTEEKELPCLRIFGIASGTKLKNAANGDKFEAIVGDFEAHNLETGEVFNSGVLYLPAGLHERVAEPLKAEGAEAIQFGIEISAFPANNPSGYSYKAKNVVKSETADPLAALRAQAVEGMKLLPAAKDKAKKA